MYQCSKAPCPWPCLPSPCVPSPLLPRLVLFADCSEPLRNHLPARFFSRKALSSSSRSFLSFFGAFKGLIFPPVRPSRVSLGYSTATKSAGTGSYPVGPGHPSWLMRLLYRIVEGEQVALMIVRPTRSQYRSVGGSRVVVRRRLLGKCGVFAMPRGNGKSRYAVIRNRRRQTLKFLHPQPGKHPATIHRTTGTMS